MKATGQSDVVVAVRARRPASPPRVVAVVPRAPVVLAVSAAAIAAVATAAVLLLRILFPSPPTSQELGKHSGGSLISRLS